MKKVKQANELIRATHRMTNREIKTMFYGLATRNKGETEVNIPLSEMFRKLDIEYGDKQKSDFTESILNLMEKSKLFIPASQSRTGDNIAGYIIPTTIWNDKNNTFKMTFNPIFLPLLDNLKDNYTWVYLEQIALLKGKYSIRIYEFLKMILPENKNQIRFRWYLNNSSEKAPSFRKFLDLENKHPRFNNLRARVIEPSFKEINKVSNLMVEYEIYKRGRDALAIDMTITKKDFIDSDILDGQTTIEEYIDDDELGDILKNFD